MAALFPAAHFVLDCRGRLLDCRPDRDGGAHVVGILNVTPDSFSDGGLYTTVEAALRRADALLREGAAVLDVGGASSRPRGAAYGDGAAVVEADAERRRVLPVLEALRDRFPEALLSIDTFRPEVARDALAVGVHLVNDITGGRFSPETARLAAAHGAPYIVMHSLGTPGAMPHTYDHADVVRSVQASLRASIAQAEAAGVRHVVVDPGFGFGKSPAANLALAGRADAFVALGRPVLLGVSRKHTLGVLLGSETDPALLEDRLFAGLGVTAAAVLRGVSLVRTHDVRPTADLLKALAAVTAAVRAEEEAG